ncbi:dnaJsubfamily C member 9-like [Tropilaelaps mercedesae]|uniref:DnaJsubfamily C member 9-like n=1 Tax=Tropilaelaps mercedesae TaxID=418985 RepID=A0A1V9XMQ4_9ACAR|nr:dnaJsubfamily C member 9-like [Tropilaelaps mercedesae]
MGLLDDAKETFGANTLYDVFGVEKTVAADRLKKAYRKKSLLCHPDKAKQGHKEEFTKKFQILCKCFEILQDNNKRKLYDETGSVDDDSFNADKDWEAYWRCLFPKITVNQIQEFIDKYHGSEEEREDLKRSYEKSKGDMNKIAEYLIGYDVYNEDRLCKLLYEMIDAGEITEYRAFTKESAASKRKRQKKYAREAKEAEQAGKSMNELALMIHQNDRKRLSEGEDFLAALEAKYATSKQKKTSGSKKK